GDGRVEGTGATEGATCDHAPVVGCGGGTAVDAYGSETGGPASTSASAAVCAVARSKRASGSTAVALKNQASNAGGRYTPDLRWARATGGSVAPRTTFMSSE